MRPKDILLYNSKKYESVKRSFEEGTYKAEQLKKISQMSVNCERLNNYTNSYQKYGLVLIIFSVIHIIMFTAAVLTAELLMYAILTFALVMTWYSFYSKKTVFTYVASLSCIFGLIIDFAMQWYTPFIVWGLMLTVVITGLSPLITSLNREYIYLTKQEGYPHFMYILDEEIQKNKKALADEIDNYYATKAYAPPEKRGIMDELDIIPEAIEARPDQRNNYMDTV